MTSSAPRSIPPDVSRDDCSARRARAPPREPRRAARGRRRRHRARPRERALPQRVLPAPLRGRVAPGQACRSGVALAAVGSFGRGAVALRSDADVVLIVDPHDRSARSEAGAFAEALLYPLWDATLAGRPPGAERGRRGRRSPRRTSRRRRRCSICACSPATRTLLRDAHRARERGPLRRGGAGRVHRSARGRGRGAPRALRRLGVPARAGREERRGRPARPRRRALGGARALPRRRRADGRRAARRLGRARAARACSSRARRTRSPTAEEFLWRVRNRLHARAGRKADRLGFEEQEALAVAMGYGDDRARAAERLMQDYYLHARAVTRARASLLRAPAAAAPPRQGRRRRRPRRRACTSSTGRSRSPAAPSCQTIRRSRCAPTRRACGRRRRVLPFARDAIARAAADPAWCERLRASPEAAAALRRARVHGARDADAPRARSWASCTTWACCSRWCRSFCPVTGRVHHDVYHVYTVDVHSVAAVDRLRQLARGELAHEFPLASRLAAEIARPRPLFLATLLHDVGKGWPDASGSRKNHSKSGRRALRRASCRASACPARTSTRRRQLVRDHLLMYHVATRRDLDDPATIEEFCREPARARGAAQPLPAHRGRPDDDVADGDDVVEGADARRALLRRRGAPRRAAAARRRRARRARARGRARGVERADRSRLEAFLASMPERYLLANAAGVDRRSTPGSSAERGGAAGARRRASRRGTRRRPSCASWPTTGRACSRASRRPSPPTGSRCSRRRSTRAPRRRGARGGRPLLGARPRRRHRGRRARAAPARARSRRRVLGPGRPGGAPSRARPAPSRRGASGRAPRCRRRSCSTTAPRRATRSSRCSRRTGPGFSTRSRDALHELGLSIALSKINTEGARVADVFYVSELDGSKVAPGARHQQIHDALVRAVAE